MYAKVFRQLWDGSLCGQSDAQLVFIYLLAHSDADGYVCQPRAAIAAKTGLAVESVLSAIETLEAPDEASGSDAEGGRRLLRTIPARDEWHIVNHSKYRGMRDEDERRRQNREAQQRRRKPPSAIVSRGNPPSAHTEADTEAVGSRQKTDASSTPPAPSPRAARPRSARIPAETSVELLTNRSEPWRATQEEMDAWALAYPAMDVRGTMLEMAAWIIANPDRRKTWNGMPRFVNHWLSKEQNRAS